MSDVSLYFGSVPRVVSLVVSEREQRGLLARTIGIGGRQRGMESVVLIDRHLSISSGFEDYLPVVYSAAADIVDIRTHLERYDWLGTSIVLVKAR